MPKKLPAPVGAVFGSWTVLAEVELRQFPSGQSARMMRCRCKCGCTADVQLRKLKSHSSKQCRRCASTTHGKSYSAEAQAWYGMHDRCYGENRKRFINYGSRGVHVCERWHRDNPDGFVNFLKDMGPRPSAKHSLDKDILKPGNMCYCPEFCCWATTKAQNQNRRGNRMLEYLGKTQCISAWAEELGIAHQIIRGRLDRGWTVEDALTRPSAKRKTA